MQQSISTPRIAPLPAELSSTQAKLVYLFLATTGGATLDDLKETLAMQKIAILSVVASLRSDGLVEKDGEVYVPSR